MPLQSSTLRPGLLVSLKTSIAGGVSYAKVTIEPEHVDADGAQRARWQTERVVVDPDEHKRAKQARSQARAKISGVCAVTSFGLLCPEADAGKLEEAVNAARQIARDFNATSQTTKVEVYVLTGRVAPDDVEAMRAINAEVRDLMEQMERGIATLDVDAIRDGANRARKIGTMLSPEVAAKVKDSVDAARAAARKIVKAGEAAAAEVSKFAVEKLTTARTAFLDLDEHDAPTLVAPQEEGRAVDLVPLADCAAPAAPLPLFEMEV